MPKRSSSSCDKHDKTTKKIKKTVKTLREDGYWTRDDYTAYKTGKVLYRLPDGAQEFVWEAPSHILDAKGKFIRVHMQDDSKMWAEITGVYRNTKNSIYRIHSTVGTYTFKERHSYRQKPKWNERQLKILQVVANHYVKCGDLMEAIVKGYPNWKYENLIPKFYILKKSPTFSKMVKNKIKKALEKHDIDEDFIVSKYKELIESALTTEDHNSMLKALVEIEKIVSIASQPDNEGLPQLNGEQALNKKELLAKKDELARLKRDNAEEVEYVEEEDPSDEQE